MNQPPTTRITGIHHLTAVSSDAQRTVDFYTRVLGWRLVKQTVDVDDPSSYHLTFADEDLGPGALTFVERKGARRGQWGLGGTHHLAFETRDRDTLRQWKRWLTDHGLPVTGPYNRFRRISGVGAGIGSGQVSAAMAASSRPPIVVSGGGSFTSRPRASGASSKVQPGPRVAISRMSPSGSVK